MLPRAHAIAFGGMTRCHPFARVSPYERRRGRPCVNTARRARHKQTPRPIRSPSKLLTRDESDYRIFPSPRRFVIPTASLRYLLRIIYEVAAVSIRSRIVRREISDCRVLLNVAARECESVPIYIGYRVATKYFELYIHEFNWDIPFLAFRINFINSLN